MPKKRRGDEKVYRYGKIYKYDNNGNYITEFESYQSCCDLEKISPGHLWDILNDGKTKRVKNYIYTYDFYLKFPVDKKLIDGRKKGVNPIKVYQYDLNGNFIKEWINISEAHRILKINRAQINKASKSNFRNKAGNFLWSRTFIKKVPKYKRATNGSEKIVLQYNLKGKLINTYDSARDAMRKTKITTISYCLINRQKTAGGYIWKYKK